MLRPSALKITSSSPSFLRCLVFCSWFAVRHLPLFFPPTVRFPLFRVLLLRHIHLPLPLSSHSCRCGHRPRPSPHFARLPPSSHPFVQTGLLTPNVQMWKLLLCNGLAGGRSALVPSSVGLMGGPNWWSQPLRLAVAGPLRRRPSCGCW